MWKNCSSECCSGRATQRAVYQFRGQPYEYDSFHRLRNDNIPISPPPGPQLLPNHSHEREWQDPAILGTGDPDESRETCTWGYLNRDVRFLGCRPLCPDGLAWFSGQCPCSDGLVQLWCLRLLFWWTCAIAAWGSKGQRPPGEG